MTIQPTRRPEGRGERRRGAHRAGHRCRGVAGWAHPAWRGRAVLGAVARSLSALALIGALGCALPGPAEAGAHRYCPDRLASLIPARAADAATGSGFARATAQLSPRQREARIGAEILAGNVPDFLRRLEPVTLPGGMPWGRSEVTICVTPDYLALGADDDFLRIPMALPTAFTVAERFGFVLPTARMVDAIYLRAGARLEPEPLPPTHRMRSIGYYRYHDALIRAQRLGHGAPLGTLIAGQKKDLVLTNRLRRERGRVAIYGWHRPDGRPIQPLSTVHGARYADYSHGVRLVSRIAWVDGWPRRLAEVLEDPHLAPIVSDEGPIRRLATLIGTLASHRQMAAAGNM